jgi:hypothetical protein
VQRRGRAQLLGISGTPPQAGENCAQSNYTFAQMLQSGLEAMIETEELVCPSTFAASPLRWTTSACWRRELAMLAATFAG